MGEILDALNKAERDPRQGERTGPNSNARAPAFSSSVSPSPPPPPSPAGYTLVLSPSDVAPPAAQEVLANPSGPAAEAYRKTALKIRAELKTRNARSLAINSAVRGEGKTTTACNLALALASMGDGQRLALACLDFRRPNVARSLGVMASVGIEQVLREEVPFDAACARTNLEGLDLYLPKAPQDAPHKFLAGEAFRRFHSTLESRYDIVIMDTPPVLLVPDAVILSRLAGAWLFIVRSGASRARMLKEALGELPRDNFLGTILNETHLTREKQYYTNYGYEPVPEDEIDGK